MPNTSRDPKLVATLVYDGLCTFEFVITQEVLHLTRPPE
ncbi:MAG: transcriptional regulator FtrA, partial [Pseudomonadota bacterium]